MWSLNFGLNLVLVIMQILKQGLEMVLDFR